MRVAIFAIAALSVFGMHSFAESVLASWNSGTDMVDPGEDGEPTDSAPTSLGRSYILHYDEKVLGEDSLGYRNIYKQYYIIGSEDAVGLVDSSGKVILPQDYQDIIVLPQTYILKENSAWHFYDRNNLTRLDDNDWDEVEIELNEQKKIISDMVKVAKDGVYGATTLSGELIINPRWHGLELYTYEAAWPLIRVQEDGLFGFINSSGDVIINVRYDYAQLDTYTTISTDDSGNEEELALPIIYVRKDDDWGGIFRGSDGYPAAVDWDIEPSTEVLTDYDQSAI